MTVKFPKRNGKPEKNKAQMLAKSRTYRIDVKALRGDLRRQEKELCEELLRLEEIRKEHKAKENAGWYTGQSLWRELATRQRVERDTAESQQKKLRFLISNQATYIDILRDVLTKRCTDPIVVLGHQETASPFARYLHELNTRYYLYTDEVFKATDLSHSHDIDQTVELDGGVKFFYPRSTLVLPSSVSETSNTLWKLGEHLFSDKQSYVQHHNVEDSSNTFVVSFTDTNVLETGDTVQISHWYVARRFIQDKRVVIGWKHIFQGEGILCGLKEDETGWCRFYSSADVMEPGTVMEMRIHRVVVHSTDPAPQESILRAFHNFLITETREVLVNVVATLENMLLENALADIC
ncbi:uncharacterized protein PITG_15238 [Phytophthora infestans T30-4]|uniref:M96 mating-specific protein family n=1 Tax=Phytophthora infestans (strain T30-4) TaxID=403677 RepID=D0NQ79_PHYIT|nr:uncharacterized protein PITG_15238 [Phytophthora infestans T30-4]EEY62811.1 conserved hypothetical protein [Phytophthora infestans T30-4]|eukprot:XP_002898686.1 conserved hypothetical protein [Phytophthora infestans T30-4]